MVRLDDLRIGFLGAGAMGEALAAAVCAAGVDPARLRAADPVPERGKALEERIGLRSGTDNREVVAASDLVVLAVKPGLVDAVLAGVRDERAAGEVLWISIAAGVRLETLEAALPPGARVVRAMPNTPALAGAGATAFVANAACQAQDRDRALALFETVGLAWEAPDEALLDAVTGLSGSGPAYVFVLLEALSDAGVRMGLPRDAAAALATQTVYGAAKLAIESGRHPAALKDQVTSPGGTTIAGLEALEQGGLRAAVYAAVAAATARSRELGEG
ncbi:MAG: pyrroline-5-carboxylate reductase [Planctomycetota bacterium]|nr:pyrroline-5-carboxylate reductase [Deltaproteobacteria bacterium]MDP6540757.1 pyrroline-5-carboxylate reductase [Planctomycetota bacterium]